jgi:hypothetical protein
MDEDFPEQGTAEWRNMLDDRVQEMMRVAKDPCDSVVKIAVQSMRQKKKKFDAAVQALADMQKAVSATRLEHGVPSFLFLLYCDFVLFFFC